MSYRSTFPLFAALVALMVFAGCSDPATSTPDPDPTIPCDTSSDCDGQLCLLNECLACVDDAACARDDLYGVGATCNDDGICESCFGQDGCACDEGACDDGLRCTDDVCEVCPEGNEGCGCFGNGTCLDGLRCGEGDLCEPCPAGEEGCACNDEECDNGLVCMEDLCVEDQCVVGQVDCPCRDDEDNACDEGLTCSDGGLCAECSPDIEGCPCDEDGECEGDLVCDEDEETCREPQTCEDLGCVANQLCQDEDEGVDAICLEECAEGFVFNLETGVCDEAETPGPNCQPEAESSILAMCQGQNRACVEGEDTAECGDCLPDFVEEAEQCRAAVTCAGLTCADENRQCIPNQDNTDAACGECLMGFEEVEGLCQPIPEANCIPNAEDSILADCNAQDRLCVEDGQTAACGDCREGFAEDPNTQLCTRRLCIDTNCAALGRECDGEPLAECGDCLENLVPSDPNDPLSQCNELVACADIEAECQENGQFCVERDGQDAVCADWPCLLPDNTPDFNRAFRVDQNRCTLQECGLGCGLEGETGRIHPQTLRNSERCVCETLPGYYILPEGDFTAKPCDQDGDGWVALPARDALESGDDALESNARCDLRTIDRIVLENEYRQTRTIKLCEEGPVPEVSCEVESCDENGFNCSDCNGGRCNPLSNICECELSRRVDLYESVRNDDQETLNSEGELSAPTYGTDIGRPLRSEELNPMTKACISVSGDANDNGVRDIVEWQGDEPTEDADLNLFSSFAYFVELHEGRYERTLGQDVGRYHIREKSRCEADFPVQYNSERDGEYWRDCTRNRDVDFDRTGDNRLIGHEFAQWTCDQPSDGCPTPPPLTDVTADGEIPPHGLCEEGVTLPPVDGIWRGMNHSGQFKCTEITDVLPEDRDTQSPHLRTLEELARADGLEGGFQMNACTVACPNNEVVYERPESDFADVSDLTFNGSAEQVGQELVLADGAEEVGSAFITEPIDMTNVHRFNTHFEVHLASANAGFTFMLQGSGPTALGNGFGELGAAGISPSVMVEFDLAPNGDPFGDLDGNHVALNVGGVLDAPLAYGESPFALSDPLNPFFVWIEYENQTMSLFISQSNIKPGAPLWSADIDLVEAVGPQAWAGFTASICCNRIQPHSVKTWELQIERTLEEQELRCALDCDDEEGCRQSSIAQDGNPALPVIQCAPQPREQLAIGQVGFAAARYVEGQIGIRSCVAEGRPDPALSLSEPWREMCPGYINNPEAVLVDSHPGDFGRLLCGCGFNYGGANCDLGCTGSLQEGQVHYGGDAEGSTCINGYCAINPEAGGGRTGFWMCGGFSTTSYEDTDEPALRNEEGWELKSEVPLDGISRQRLCTDDDCSTGFSVR